MRWGERRTISWVWEKDVRERFWARVQPAQPVPRMRMRGLVPVDVEREVLERFVGVGEDEESVETGRFEVGFGAEVGAGVEGREEVCERVVGAMLALVGSERGWKARLL